MKLILNKLENIRYHFFMSADYLNIVYILQKQINSYEKVLKMDSIFKSQDQIIIQKQMLYCEIIRFTNNAGD